MLTKSYTLMKAEKQERL